MQSLYDILGVPVAASQAEVQEAYRQLLLRCHPDRCYHDNDSAIYNPNADVDEIRTRMLNTAHDVLSNPVQRQLYDAYLAHRLRSDVATDGGLDSIMQLLSTSLTLPNTPQLLLTTTTPSHEEAPSEQQQIQVVSPTSAAVGSEASKPVVYTAAISVQRQPDGTVSVRSHRSGPQPIDTLPFASEATTADATARGDEHSTSTGAATAASNASTPKEQLPRRVRVMAEQLSSSSRSEVDDELNQAMVTLANSLLSLATAAASV
jgi:curved DNA-binding protein CbpA